MSLYTKADLKKTLLVLFSTLVLFSIAVAIAGIDVLKEKVLTFQKIPGGSARGNVTTTNYSTSTEIYQLDVEMPTNTTIAARSARNYIETSLNEFRSFAANASSTHS